MSRSRCCVWGNCLSTVRSALTAAVCMAAAVSSAASFTWTGGDAGSGAWNSSANWDAAGVAVSSSTNDLVFSANANAFMSSNNLAANPFLVKFLTFGSGLPGAFTVQGANPFSFPASAIITQASANKVTIEAPMKYSGSSTYLTFGGSGGGDVELKGLYSFNDQSYLTLDPLLTGNIILNQVNFGGRTSIIYNKIPVSSGKEFRLNGLLNFTTLGGSTYFYDVGKIVVNGQFTNNAGIPGSVVIEQTAPGWTILNNPAGNFVGNLIDLSLKGSGGIDLGGVTHTLRDATFYSAAASNGTLAVRNFYLDYGTVKIPIVDAPNCQANLVKRIVTNNDSWIETPMNHSGLTQTLCSDITFRGLYGAATNSAVDIDMAPQNGEPARIILDNGLGNNNNRLSDTRPVTIKAGHLLLYGNASVPTTESIGDVTISKYCQFRVDAAAGGVSALNGLSLLRSDYATLLLDGDSLGNAAAPNVSQIAFTTPPNLTTGTFATVGAPVLPWAVAITSFGSGYALPATYGANGFRALAAGEYVSTFTADANMVLTANTAMGGTDMSVKSLTIRPPADGTYTASGIGSEKLTITDGVIISTMGNQTPQNYITIPYLTFGNNPITGYEGILHVHNANANGLTIDSAIIDNGANAVSLTKSGPTIVRLRGNNNIGGTLRVNEGVVSVQDNPGTVPVETTTVRDVLISTSISSALDIGAGSQLTTTGTGTVVRLTRNYGNASISGSGTLALSGDLRLDATLSTLTSISPSVDLGAGTRTFDVQNGTADPDLVMDGIILGSGKLVKIGPGTLSLRGANSFSGAVELNAGNLYLQNAGGAIASASSVTLSGSSANNNVIYLDNTANNNNRLSDGSVNLNSAKLKIMGNAAAATTEHIGTLGYSGLNMVSIDAKAGGATRLNISSLNRTNKGFIVFCGLSLGSAAAANVAQVALDSAPTLVGSGAAATPTVGVYPLAVGSGAVDNWGSRETTSGSLLTYDAVTGFRLLNKSTEVLTSVTAAGSDNANIFGGGTITADKTINSLMANSATVAGNAGTTLTITSGLIDNISGYDPLTISVPFLTFGNNAVNGCEGIVYTHRVSDAAKTTISSVIRDNGANAVSLTIAGFGTTILSGTNAYSGPTTVISGTLKIQGNDRLPIGTSLDVQLEGIFDLQGYTQTVASISGKGAIRNSVAGAAKLTVNNPAAVTFNGTVAGNLNLTKLGGGALTLTGPVASTGATVVTTGMLTYSGTNGYFGDITVGNGATLNLAVTSQLFAASAAFADNSTFRVEIGQPGPGGNGFLKSSGACTFDANSLLAVAPIAGFQPVKNQSWVIGEAVTLSTLPKTPKGYSLAIVPVNSLQQLTLTCSPPPSGTMILVR